MSVWLLVLVIGGSIFQAQIYGEPTPSTIFHSKSACESELKYYNKQGIYGACIESKE